MEYEVRPCLHTTSMSPVLYRSKMGSMVMFMHNIKNIQDAANKIGDIDGKCKQGLRLNVIIQNLYGMHGLVYIIVEQQPSKNIFDLAPFE